MTVMETEDFLDEDFLRKLERLKLLAGRVIKGPHKGEHGSWRSGTSLEFLDYRKYQVGDDFRYVDWNVYGRLDKLFLKLFHSEEDLRVHILMDVSRSMAFGQPPKALVAKRLAAALSYIAIANLDRVEFVSFADSIGESLGAQRGIKAYPSILRYLTDLKPKGETGLNTSLEDFASLCTRPGLAVIISDLLDTKGFKKGLEALMQRKFKTTLIQVLDHEELLPSLDGYLILKEMETGETKRITLSNDLRSLYRKKMEQFLDEIREFCLTKGIGYYLLDTRIPFEDFLFDYLSDGTLFK
ncbi:MAG: hypothetical protein A2Y79_05460 [Deltaproteobacteria bacterium RBG_13_43_22]|jgi:uncharacterized protein (DUF58 family)|nr:MAG: hypothetical protein A2Y79_05460 [Deltaproteobacteria bacterium RBG_13_43_22]